MHLQKSKVTFIHPDLGIGGAERLVLDVAIVLANEGCEVQFLTNHFDKSHAFKELQDETFPVKVVGDWLPRSISGKFYAFFAYMRMLYLAIFYLYFSTENKSDIYFVDQIPIAIPFIKWTGGKVIYYCHHPDLLASSPGGFLKTLYRKPIDWLELKGTSVADIILVNSKYTSSVFRDTFPTIHKKVTILYPTISQSLYESISSKTLTKPVDELVPEIKDNTDNKFVLLSINRFHPAKKLDLAIKALAELKNIISTEDLKRVILIIAGGHDPNFSINASYFNELVELANEMKLNNNIVLIKSPSDELKTDLLLSCDCLLYTPEKEHFGIVPLEAMAARKPVIALNSGGPRETVLNETTGFLCDINPQSMAECISKVLDKKIAKKMGDNGRKRLEQLFTNSVFHESVVKICNKLLNE
ncbi:alpha-1,3/1,6-mannosyltransferase ALG2 isoform X2 [Agrilus planipennis]|uniref:Alpha-1,3/1,6-mannosyltransferase ALG2 n=1 Tax=Agrilus planipennis TaxID=224129 RepID=A0A7F5R350_AGRPL|nr:alpha-1,3/1,6-mannosyltransferase ALG2 isoform X2 [Agrilus planipennis]